MSNLHRSLEGSVSFRHDWRPSPLLCVLLPLMGIAAAFSVLHTLLPRWLAWPLAALVLMHGAWRTHRYGRSLPAAICIPAGAPGPTVDGQPVDALELDWRGPCAMLAWRDRAGRRHRRLWMPGQLTPAARRELRLAVADFHASRTRPTMAP